jgi:serine/threonine protein kinase
MNDNKQSAACPKCGAPLASGTVDGLCPACLLALNLATQTECSGATNPLGAKVAKEAALAPEAIAKKFPHFEIICCLGRGGMGVVYQARQKSLDRVVALKILAPEREKDPQFAARFAREAKTLAQLNHPNIVTVHDFGETEGMFYLVMEFVDGVNLRHLLGSGHLTPPEALAIVPPICDALEYAHRRGIVHRDIKPENLLLDKQGRVKIADFGIARILADGREAEAAPSSSVGSEPNLTAKNALGTPKYMAPEQSLKPSEVDQRADIYSIGVVFYEMLTGELPKDQIVPPSHKVPVDARLDEIVLRALARDPNRRYKNAGEVKMMVETFVAETANSPGDAPAVRPASSGLPRFSRLAIAGAAGAFFFLVMVVWLILDPELSDNVFSTSNPWKEFFYKLALPVGIAAVLATTFMGWIAVAQIRRSAGRLYGMGLAVFDGLMLPLLGLDAAVFLILVFAAKAIAAWRGLDGSMFASLWDMALWAAILGLSICWIDYLIIRLVWKRVSPPKTAGESVPGDDTSARKNLFLVSVALGGAAVLLVPTLTILNENARKAQIGYPVRGGEVHYRVFEVGGVLVDQLVPADMRENGASLGSKNRVAAASRNPSQTAQLDGTTLDALLVNASTNAGFLAEKWAAFEELYHLPNKAWNYGGATGFGSGEGNLMVSKKHDVIQLGARYRVNHTFHGARAPVTAEISYLGAAPPMDCARAFLIPFTRDSHSNYLVITFEVDATARPDARRRRGND